LIGNGLPRKGNPLEGVDLQKREDTTLLGEKNFVESSLSRKRGASSLKKRGAPRTRKVLPGKCCEGPNGALIQDCTEREFLRRATKAWPPSIPKNVCGRVGSKKKFCLWEGKEAMRKKKNVAQL